jgi:hypothetical protein
MVVSANLPAAGEPSGPGTPGVRASDADRDRVVDILRVAAGDGRLTPGELDERLERPCPPGLSVDSHRSPPTWVPGQARPARAGRVPRA